MNSTAISLSVVGLISERETKRSRGSTFGLIKSVPKVNEGPGRPRVAGGRTYPHRCRGRREARAVRGDGVVEFMSRISVVARTIFYSPGAVQYAGQTTINIFRGAVCVHTFRPAEG